ncbi:hypothetical protein GQ53DRAFT_153580 [Thozetella sp. PMI_491]|nr:hypothetical protein GQ53DRAFT_153580 [Thozetella sp. PMI_491]
MSPEGAPTRSAGMGAHPVPAPTGANGVAAASGQKAKRARTSKPKVKTGCSNCKQRRIKCDEKRPACSNCVRSKKMCTGYPPPPRSARLEEIRIAPKPSTAVDIQPYEQTRLAPRVQAQESIPPPGREQIILPPRRAQKLQRRYQTPPYTPIQAPPPLIYQLSTLPFSEQEGLYFQLFQERTASELSGFFDNLFWSRVVLQECHSEAAVRHAVVALGALYKTLEKSTESPPGSPNEDHDPMDSPMRHWEMAVKQYSQAINTLMDVNTADTKSHRMRLMASILLACFDSFIGDHKQAIFQIQNGLRLLEQLRAERRRAFLPRPEEPVEEELIQMFTRLAIQAKSYDMAFHFPRPWVITLTTTEPSDPSSPSSEGASPVSLQTQDPLPEQFTTAKEARLAWDSLVERIFRFTETMFNYAQDGPTGVLPASLRQYGLRFKNEIEAWSDAFDHILASRNLPGVTSQEKTAIAALKMGQIMSQVLFLMTFSDSEAVFDNFTPQFKAIIDLALEVVGDEERRAAAKRCPDPQFCEHRYGHAPDIFGGHEYAAHHIKASFSADLGIVPPLYVVATKCRNPVIRRQAIQLLRSSSRREGMWDSELAARIGMWIAEIEEEEDPLLTPGQSPVQTNSRPSTSGSSVRLNGSMDFGDNALGPGGNARWDARRESQTTLLGRNLQRTKAVPEEKRVMVRAVEFDLRERFAIVQLGTRGLPNGAPDRRSRGTKIVW